MNDYNDLAPKKGMMGLAVKWLLFIAVFLLVARFVLYPLFFVDKAINREVQKYDAETSAQVYDTSRPYQEGINRDVARYCRDWKTTEGVAKVAVANLIRDTVATFKGTLSDTNQKCVDEIG